ncbi:MAG: 5-dehydro-4-deoxy-D-glucuronate isomerase [bacterium]|nr:MAG: 5-dehydro-4-deoxy-D-glucuronate isomerase [bacterium]
MKIRYLADQVRYQTMDTDEFRQTFLVEDLFQKNKLVLYYTETDRAIVGSAVPVKKELSLPGGKELASDFFAQRREVGVINIGSAGSVKVDGKVYKLANRDALYIGRGARKITFVSQDEKKPAKYYILSYPAHKSLPNCKVAQKEAEAVHLGNQEMANKRTIYKYIRPPQVESCQLVMGLTTLENGNVWNTMSPHTHERRTEIYMYFDLGKQILFHFMGKPEQTRHLVVREGQAVISPSWSIHAGAGTCAYSFIWGMGGENQEFDDMDGVNFERIN